MVGRLQGTCGGIGGEATTVIIMIVFRAPLRPNRLTTTFNVSNGCRLIILCPCVILQDTEKSSDRETVHGDSGREQAEQQSGERTAIRALQVHTSQRRDTQQRRGDRRDDCTRTQTQENESTVNSVQSTDAETAGTREN